MQLLDEVMTFANRFLCAIFASVILFGVCFAQSLQQTELIKTKIVVLGVNHSPQLAAESYQPAVFRAFFDRVKPDAVCIERSPQEFARNDYYEFTYEQQYLTVPYAKEHRLPLYAIDWLPSADDTLLAFNISDLERPLFVRRKSGFQGFLSFPDRADLNLDLFHAETESDLNKQRSFANAAPPQARADFARRLYLYRTFMQAMRVLRAAQDNRGQTVLVVVGSLHKADIEQILKSESSVEIVQPSAFGRPAADAIAQHTRREDLFAIASFNLLGVQSATSNINFEWLRRTIARLESERQTAETLILKTRSQVLTNEASSQEVLANYQRATEMAQPDEQFTWTGVKDRSRVDSYFDPFGNLSIKQRAQLEAARENYKLKQTAVAEAVRQRLQSQLSPLKSQQLAAYWDEFVIKML